MSVTSRITSYSFISSYTMLNISYDLPLLSKMTQKIKRILQREVRDWREEVFRFTSDMIRVYNKYFRKYQSLDVWVVFK